MIRRRTVIMMAAGALLAAIVYPPTTQARPACMPSGNQLEAIRSRATREARAASPHHHVRYHAWTLRYRQLLGEWRQRCWQADRTVTGVALASWYGPEFWGHSTSSGSTLQLGDRTVAHRSLPFGSVCSFWNGQHRAVGYVRDRGPFVAGRTFDLEQSLARSLGIGGVGAVHYSCVRPPP